MMTLLWLANLVFTVWFMLGLRSKAIKTLSPLSRLDTTEKIIVWITCVISPIISGSIFYYGWKKTLPIKAKQANRISWMALVILAIVGFFYLANSSPNLINYLIGKTGSNTAISEVGAPYLLVSNRDSSTWSTYASSDGYIFKYPFTNTVIDNSPLPNSISEKTSPDQIFLTFKFAYRTNPMAVAKALVSLGKEKMEIRDVSVGDISGKAVISSSNEIFIFSVGNGNVLIFNVPLNISPSMAHSVISTLSAVK